MRMVHKEIGWGVGGDLVGSEQGRVAVSCEYGDEPSISGPREIE
jgi:hypothetical protein